MADPLSITLAVITLATALNDLIELAQKISESFQKPARNVRVAKSLAEETLEIITGLKDFYDRHKEKLETALEMREAVLKLLRDMKAVYDKCTPVLQIYGSSNGKLCTIIKNKIVAWRNRDDLEEHIRYLRDLASKCHRQFMTFALVRIEASTAEIQAAAVEIQTTTIQIRSAVADGFARGHGYASPLRVSDNSALAFMGSAPTILSKLPPYIILSEPMVYRSFITVQVSKIDTLFKILASSGSYPVEEPDSAHLQPFLSVLRLQTFTDEERESAHSDVFALMVRIQESLKSTNNQLSIQRGAFAMSTLSTLLFNLGMVQESLTIIQCAVDLYRTLNKTNEDAYGPHLAHVLRKMSHRYMDIGDVVRAYKEITEAVNLGRLLADANQAFDIQLQVARLISFSAYVGRHWNGDSTNASKEAEEAVQCYQRVIETHEWVLEAEPVVMEGTRLTWKGSIVYDFANALEELHWNLLSTTRNEESVKAGVQALDLFRALEQRHRSNGYFGHRIAKLCFSLASAQFREIIHAHEALLYAQESVQHYEKMLQNIGVIPDPLFSALGLQVGLLSSLDRLDEAYGVCQRLERMIQIHIDSQQLRSQLFLQLIQHFCDLRRYAEAALKGEQLLSIHRSLLSDEELLCVYNYTSLAFCGMDEHCKSIQVAEASVNHWRMLTLHETKYLKYVASSVHALAWACFLAEDYKRAVNEGTEALKLFGQLITEDCSLLQQWIEALEFNMNIAKHAKMEFESLERSRLVVQYCRALVNQFPAEQLFFIRSIRDHAKLLEDFNYLADASVAISEALEWFNNHPAQDSESAELHTRCLLDSARFLHFQGHPDRVLSAESP